MKQLTNLKLQSPTKPKVGVVHFHWQKQDRGHCKLGCHQRWGLFPVSLFFKFRFFKATSKGMISTQPVAPPGGQRYLFCDYFSISKHTNNVLQTVGVQYMFIEWIIVSNSKPSLCCFWSGSITRPDKSWARPKSSSTFRLPWVLKLWVFFDKRMDKITTSSVQSPQPSKAYSERGWFRIVQGTTSFHVSLPGITP